LVQKSAEVAEFLAHKKWVLGREKAAKMTEAAARRCVEKLKARDGGNPVVVPL
jgi:hypothetical protein